MSPCPDADSLTLFADHELPGSSGPDFAFEAQLISRGHAFIAGVDEAGRGPLAGPVVAAAVILDPDAIPDGLNDSKKLSAPRREALFGDILAAARSVAWSATSAREIDRVNIREATFLAMCRSVQSLTLPPSRILIDGRDVPVPLKDRGTAIVRGDGKSVSIAAASIIAKVIRDRMMARASVEFPEYGFSDHSGYGTARHMDAISRHGPTPLHRMSFAPLRTVD